MKEIDVKQLIEKARKYNQEKTSWHHHYLTPKCIFNTTKKHQIILENEDTKQTYHYETENPPLKELKELEKIYFQKKVDF